jgi:ADP-ribose pyrophosphatase
MNDLFGHRRSVQYPESPLAASRARPYSALCADRPYIILLMKPPAEVEVAFRGSLFDVHVISQRRDGQSCPPQAATGAVREIVRHPGAVLIVPVLADSRLVMILNRRVAVDETLWEFPAGKLERGESPAVAAARELEEETGYRAGRITPLAEFYTSPGFTDELMHTFVAEQLAGQGKQRLEEGEDIEARVITREEALAMAGDGRLRDGKSIAALLLWDRRNVAHSELGTRNSERQT